MTHYNLIVIGFGKAGKTLAEYASSQGQQVALIGQFTESYGSTYINHGCIPSEVLVNDDIKHVDFSTAFSRKKEVVNALSQKNYLNLENDENITLLNFKTQFKPSTEVELIDEKGKLVQTLTTDKILINTSAKSNIPNIEGIDSAQNVHDSKGLLNISYQPKELVIIGGGHIVLEFASMFQNFGTNITVLEYSKQFMVREDQEIIIHMTNDFKDKGVSLITNAETKALKNDGDLTTVEASQRNFTGDTVLLATGRILSTDLALDNTDIELGTHGEIKVNNRLQTSVSRIYVAGDIKGGLQFTYISLDGFRILKSELFGDRSRHTENRGMIPHTVFIDPPLSRVDMTALEAQKLNYNYVRNTLFTDTLPKYKINSDDRGLFKVVTNKDNDEILGATLYGKGSEEIVNLIKLAIDQHIPYQVLRDNIYTHPTITESFNDLLST